MKGSCNITMSANRLASSEKKYFYTSDDFTWQYIGSEENEHNLSKVECKLDDVVMMLI